MRNFERYHFVKKACRSAHRTRVKTWFRPTFSLLLASADLFCNNIFLLIHLLVFCRLHDFHRPIWLFVHRYCLPLAVSVVHS